MHIIDDLGMKTVKVLPSLCLFPLLLKCVLRYIAFPLRLTRCFIRDWYSSKLALSMKTSAKLEILFLACLAISTLYASFLGQLSESLFMRIKMSCGDPP